MAKYIGQGDKDQLGARIRADPVREAGREDDQAGTDGHAGIQRADVQGLARQGIIPAHVAAKDFHSANAKAEGKERLVHGSHNDIANAHFGGTVPVRQQVERQALARAGQHKAVHSQNQDQHKQRAHHPFANAFNAVLQTAAADEKSPAAR